MSITWNRAAKLCGADTKELKDWPERLSIEQAAILAAGNRSADFTAAAEAMHEAIERGDLPAEDAERLREVRLLLREPDRFEVLAAGPCKRVAAGDVLAWFGEQERDPGEHVRAWDSCIQDRRGRELARAEVARMGLFLPANQRERPKGNSDFSWNRAKRLPLVSLTDEERAAGWPDALTLENFASMQFPMEGDESARRTARKARTALLATMREAIAARELDAEERRREVQREVDDGRLFEPIPLASSPRGWFERARGPWPRRTITEIETRHTITREAAAEFLVAQGIEPSEHIRAWRKRCDAVRAEYTRAFDLVCRLDEAKATAARLRDAADRTTGREREANIRQAEAAEAEAARIEAALRGDELAEAPPSATEAFTDDAGGVSSDTKI